MQADLQPGVAQRCNNAFRDVFGLLRSNFGFCAICATLANCSCNYRIHLMMIMHYFTPPLIYKCCSLRWFGVSYRPGRSTTLMTPSSLSRNFLYIAGASLDRDDLCAWHRFRLAFLASTSTSGTPASEACSSFSSVRVTSFCLGFVPSRDDAAASEGSCQPSPSALDPRRRWHSVRIAIRHPCGR
jgi:hypothetical protein